MDNCKDLQNLITRMNTSLPLCRVCLDVSMEYIEFEATLCDVNGHEITFLEAFQDVIKNNKDLPLQNSQIPSYFCVNCGKDLLNAYLFIKRIENTNSMLNMVYASTKERCNSESKKEESFDNNIVNCIDWVKLENIEDKEYVEEQELTAPEESVDNEDFLTEETQMSDKCNDKNCRDTNESGTFLYDENGILHKTKEDLQNHKQLSHGNNDTQSIHEDDQSENYNFDSKIFDEYMCLSKEHNLESKDKQKYICNVCSCEFVSKRILNIHKIRVHRINKLKNPIKHENQQNFVYNIISNSDSITNMTEYKCHICEKVFPTKIDLTKHSFSHPKTLKQYDCHICGKTCFRPFTLKKHIQHIHMSERKKYQCEECGLFFPFPSNLKEHRRKHNIAHQFQCPQCDRKFLRKPQLEIHMRYHLNYFPYKCEKCDKCYVTKSNLNDHIRAAHTMLTFDCDKCTQKFKSQTGLRKHKFIHDGYPYNCPICSIGQTSRSGMKQHMMGVHRDTVTEDEFDVMFPIIVPRTGFRRPKDLKTE